MKKSTLIWFATAASILIFAGSALAQTRSGTGQASLTLWSCNNGSCYSDNTGWSLGKCEDKGGVTCAPLPTNPTPNTGYSGGLGDPALSSPSNIKWVVGVQSFSPGPATFHVYGFLDLQNTGTDTAYLGNLVINLQTKTGGTQFHTVASDVTNSTAGDYATQAITCGGASTDGKTYIYNEGTGSGTLKLYDVHHNDLTALFPTLAATERKVLLYEATFDLNALNIKTGDSVRIEALVTFSNAGPRGGSGASCTNPGGQNFGTASLDSFNDINGDAQYTQDELYYRTVPCRTSFQVPALTHDNTSVILSDPVADANGHPIVHDPIFETNPLPPPAQILNLENQVAGLTAVNIMGTLTVNSASTDIGGGSGNATINFAGPHSYTNNVQANVSLAPDPTTGQGLAGIDNCSTLTGQSSDASILVTDPNSTNTYTFACHQSLNLKACAWPLLSVDQPPQSGNACTYTQGAWGGKDAGSNAGSYLTADYLQVYPSGTTYIGVKDSLHPEWKSITFSSGVYPVPTCPQNHKNCKNPQLTFTMVDSIESFLPQGGPSSVLTDNLSNPVDSPGGNFAGQLLTLKLNVDFGDKGYGWGTKTAPVGDIVMHLSGCENGKTVRQILYDAMQMIAGVDPTTINYNNVATTPVANPYVSSSCWIPPDPQKPGSVVDMSPMASVLDHINNFFDECKSVDGFNSTQNVTFTSN